MTRSTRSTAALVALVVAGALTAATASPGAIRSEATAASFCSVSKSVAKQIGGLASSLKSTATASQRAATLKGELTDIRKAGPALKSTAPRTLKPKVTTVLGFVNLAYAKLSAVRWNLAALAAQPQTLQAIEAASVRADPAMTTLDTYYRKVCHFAV